MTVAISAANDGIIILSFEYAANGLDWCRIYDNFCVGWLVDETMAVPRAETRPGARTPPQVTGAHAPFPLIVGSLPEPAPDTSPVISPQWAKFVNSQVFVPDLWRGAMLDFFDRLATNNGAHRLLGSRLATSGSLISYFDHWARAHPDLVLPGDAIPSGSGF